MVNKEADKGQLKQYIRQFLWYQRTTNPDRWYTMAEVEHALYPFGGWDTFDIRQEIANMKENGEIEISTTLRFRYRHKREVE